MRAKRSWVALSLFGFAYASATVAEARWSSLAVASPAPDRVRTSDR